jgi:hypothetical protein
MVLQQSILLPGALFSFSLVYVLDSIRLLRRLLGKRSGERQCHTLATIYELSGL